MATLRKKILLSLVVSSTLLTPSLFAEAENNLVNSIMTLRGEVETLYTQIDENKEAYRSQMKSYTMQIADNEAQINRQDTAFKLTVQELEKTQAKMLALSGKNEDIKPMILDAVAKLQTEIKVGIPFKTQERLGTLHQIKTDLESNTITQEKALSLVWASYDDAIRITKEIGLFKQQITLDGKETLAKIAKVGSVMMFFATPDNKVGYVAKDKVKDHYKYVITTDDKEKAQIVALFDALQKQIRTGYFQLPNALVLRGVK